MDAVACYIGSSRVAETKVEGFLMVTFEASMSLWMLILVILGDQVLGFIGAKLLKIPRF
jgi:hypothetical protein